MTINNETMGRVISLDPGGTTGYCLAFKDANHLYVAPTQAQLDHKGIYDLLTDWMPERVICEDFEYRPGKAKPALVLVSLEYIGVIKFWCSVGTEVPLYMQRAGQVVGGKNFFSDDRLKSMDIYKRGVPHGMDALRHFMHWHQFKLGYQWFDRDCILHLVEEEWIKDTYGS